MNKQDLVRRLKKPTLMSAKDRELQEVADMIDEATALQADLAKWRKELQQGPMQTDSTDNREALDRLEQKVDALLSGVAKLIEDMEGREASQNAAAGDTSTRSAPVKNTFLKSYRTKAIREFSGK